MHVVDSFTKLIILVSTLLGWHFGKKVGPALKSWNLSIQKRVSQTSGVLAQIKAIKMIGLEKVMTSLIQNLRESEITTSRGVRQIRIILVSFRKNTRPC